MTPYQRGHRDAATIARRRSEALPHDPDEVDKDP